MSYKELKSYQGAVIIYDFTVDFVKKYQSYWSNWMYKSYLDDPEKAANAMICLINQVNYLLDRQITSLKEKFLNEGGWTEQMFKERLNRRNKTNWTNRINKPNKTYEKP